jgi:hypothetical protein
MTPFYNYFSSTVLGTIALVAILALWLFKSRLSLLLALRQEKAAVGKVSVKTLSLQPYEALELNAWVDGLDGWAGRITVKRDGSESFIVECVRYRHHSGPPDCEALYIDGKKLKANSSCRVGPESLLILRQRAVMPSIVQLRLA